jgi:hypothetical protein
MSFDPVAGDQEVHLVAGGAIFGPQTVDRGS